MIKIKVVCVFAFLLFGIGLLFTKNLFVPAAHSFSSGPPPGYTAGPGEGICSECHFNNTGPGIFTINAPANYVPGQTYQIQVLHSTTDATRLRWGFQMTALDGTNAFAGAFANTSGLTQIDFGNSRFYIEHTETGTFPGTASGAAWSFNWTAPESDVGPVTFYAAGNQADNDNNFDGDQIYTTSTVTAPGGTPTATNTPTSTPTAAGTPSISGTVTYGNALAPPKYISNVTVTGTGSPNVFTTTAAPGGTAGQYTLTGFGAGSYTVSLSKTTGQNSITSNDAARIAQHVSGTNLLNTTQKVVADVSNNGVVSSFDAGQIATFVATGLSPGIAGQWRFFVPPGPTFPVAGSPTSRTYSSVTSNITGDDYVGLLIGEVTGNWTPSAARPAGRVESGKWKVESEGGRPERGIAVELPSLVSSVEKEINVPVSVQGIANKGVISYEFDLRYDASVMQPLAEAVDMKDTVSRGLSVVTNAAEPGLLRVVVYGAFPIDENGVLLDLRFRAVGSAGSVSPISFERIMFNEGNPRVEAFNGHLEIF